MARKGKAIIFLLSLQILTVLSIDRPCDYIQVRHQWQPAVCNTGKRCVENPKKIFSINDIIPSNFTTGPMGPCTGSGLDLQQIFGLQARMYKNMPSLIDGDDEELWRNIWSTHGTCTEFWFGASDFFPIGLDSYSLFNLTSYLLGSGLNPNGNTFYSKTNYQDAISFMTKKKPALSCNLDERGRDQLNFISLCYVYTTSDKSLLDCPVSINSCPDMFVWNGLG